MTHGSKVFLTQPVMNEGVEQGDPDDSDNLSEIDVNENHTGVLDTMLEEIEPIGNEVMNFAHGEAHHPICMFQDPDSEY